MPFLNHRKTKLIFVYDDIGHSLFDVGITKATVTCNLATCTSEREAERACVDLNVARTGWLVEMNTGVASECLGPDQCATTFVGPTGLGAAFIRDMWASKGTVLSTEMRAFANARWYRGG